MNGDWDGCMTWLCMCVCAPVCTCVCQREREREIAYLMNA